MRQKALQKALDALPHMKPVEKPEDYVGIPSINVLKTQTDESVHIIFAESRFDLAICPHCRKPSEKVHDREFRFIRDLPSFGKPVFIGIHIRRFACQHCDRVFTEKLDFVDRNQRQTRRFQEYVAMFCKYGTVEFASEALDMSWDATNRVFMREAEKEIYSREVPPPVYLGIDDIARSKGHTYDTVLSDLGRGCIIEILEGRRKEDLDEYFRSVAPFWGESLVAVSMDMSPAYRSVVAEFFPDAHLVADRFHVSAQLHRRMDEVRRRMQRKLKKEEKKAVFGARWALLKNVEDLDGTQLDHLMEVYERMPELGICHGLKEEFREFFSMSTSEEAASFMDYWCDKALDTGIPELAKFVQTLTNWRREILAWWEHPISQGFVEGQNNKIQTLKRRAYGYRNHDNFRLRILLACA